MLRDGLKRAYYSAAFAAKAEGRLAYLRKSRRAAILNLHRVSTERSEYWPPLTPTVFEDLLRFLTNKFLVCDITTLDRVDTDKPRAAISFDDGYYDFIEYALPLLDRYGIRANMNIVPECAITGKPIWNVRLYDFLRSASNEKINSLDIPGFEGRLHGNSPHEKTRFGLSLSAYLKNRPRSERQAILASLEPELDSVIDGATRMMNSDEVRQISDRVTIGAHSYSHDSMAYEDNSFFEKDFERCSAFFKNELALPLTIYAFPNGSYRPEQVDFLRANSIQQILLVDEEFADVNCEVKPRITVYGDSTAEVKMKALGF